MVTEESDQNHNDRNSTITSSGKYRGKMLSKYLRKKRHDNSLLSSSSYSSSSSKLFLTYAH